MLEYKKVNIFYLDKYEKYDILITEDKIDIEKRAINEL